MDSAYKYLMYSLNKTYKYDEFSITLAYGYTFEFKRYNDRTRFTEDNSISNYIINVNIKDNIGIIIYSFKMNESDTLRVLECIGEFLYYFTDTDSSMYIGLPISNSSYGHYPTLYFYNTSRMYTEDICCDIYDIPLQPTMNFNYNTGENRFIDLTVIDDAPNSHKQIIKIPMSMSEVEDFMYKICLTANIDFGEYLEKNFDDLEPGWGWGN